MIYSFIKSIILFIRRLIHFIFELTIDNLIFLESFQLIFSFLICYFWFGEQLPDGLKFLMVKLLQSQLFFMKLKLLIEKKFFNNYI